MGRWEWRVRFFPFSSWLDACVVAGGVGDCDGVISVLVGAGRSTLFVLAFWLVELSRVTYQFAAGGVGISAGLSFGFRICCHSCCHCP